MTKLPPAVLSIHDSENSMLAIDLRDILRVLEGYLGRWSWCVTWLDCHGGDGAVLCEKVQHSRPVGIWMSSRELLNFSKQIQQTVEGTFIAFPSGTDRHTVDLRELDLAEFPTSRAELAIEAVDSSWFDVYTKDPDINSQIRQNFRDVRDQDVSQYFASVGG